MTGAVVLLTAPVPMARTAVGPGACPCRYSYLEFFNAATTTEANFPAVDPKEEPVGPGERLRRTGYNRHPQYHYARPRIQFLVTSPPEGGPVQFSDPVICQQAHGLVPRHGKQKSAVTPFGGGGCKGFPIKACLNFSGSEIGGETIP